MEDTQKILLKNLGGIEIDHPIQSITRVAKVYQKSCYSPKTIQVPSKLTIYSRIQAHDLCRVC